MTPEMFANLDMLSPAQSLDLLMWNGAKYTTDGKYNQAIACFTKLLSIDPKQLGALNNLGWCYYKKGMSKDALATYRKAQRLAEDNVDTLIGFGHCYSAQGDFDKAETYYKKAFAKDPAQTDCLFWLASLRDYSVDSWVTKK